MGTFFTIPAERLGGADLARVGGKGANLDDLVRAAFPVPEGFIVDIAAYDRFVADNGLGSRRSWKRPASSAGTGIVLSRRPWRKG